METTQVKKVQIVSKGNYKLIDGEFSADDAAEIVSDMLSKKIHFHELKNFSDLIRFGSKNPKTIKRICELGLDKKMALQLINQAKESGKSVQVKSTITIELV